MAEKTQRKQAVIIALLLALAVAVVYWPVAGFDFTNYDDNHYVTSNPHVLKGLSWEGVCWAFTQGYSGNWHPLTWLSHMLDCQLFGLKPAGHHMTNLLLHMVNSVLVFLVLRSLTGALWRSACVAAFFALHPLHVESVAWIAERKDVLSAFFGLLCLWAYGRYAEVQRLTPEVPSREAVAGKTPAANCKKAQAAHFTFHVSRLTSHASFFYALALVFLALGLMCKPMLVTWPCLLLLLDFWPLGRTGIMHQGRFTFHVSRITQLLIEKVPFFALTAASSVVTFLVQRGWGAVAPLDDMPLGLRLANVPVSYLRYLGKLIWPSDLAVIYPYVQSWPAGVVAEAVLVLAGVTALALWQRHRRPSLLVGWAWFLGTLVPVIGLVQVGNQSIADRYTYLPSIGFFVLVVWGAAAVLGGSRVGRRMGATLAAMAVVIFALMARTQVSYWQNTDTLFSHTLAVTKQNAVAQNSLGFYYASRGQPEAAILAFQAALAIQPANPYSWQGLGSALIDQRKYAEAVAACDAALKVNPHMAQAHSTLGLALTKLGQTNDAVRHYEEALRLQPELAEANYNLANALAAQKQYDAARQHYEASLRSDPGSADAHNNLAYMLLQQGKLERAEAEFRLALALQPDLWQARRGLASVLMRQGKTEEANQVRTNPGTSRP